MEDALRYLEKLVAMGCTADYRQLRHEIELFASRGLCDPHRGRAAVQFMIDQGLIRQVGEGWRLKPAWVE